MWAEAVVRAWAYATLCTDVQGSNRTKHAKMTLFPLTLVLGYCTMCSISALDVRCPPLPRPRLTLDAVGTL